MAQQTTLDTLDDDALAAAFTLVYTDYVMPVNVDATWVREHVEANDIALTHSPLLADGDGNVVGLALIGVRDERGWIGGFGVAPAARGQGVSHRLIQAALDAARGIGLRQVQLEVIVGNDRAIRTYERAGFERVRDLLILSRPAGPWPIDVDTTVVVDVDVATLLDARGRMAGEGPGWQREPASLAQQSGLRALAIGSPDAPLAAAFYEPREHGFRLVDLAALDVTSAQAMLAALVERTPDASITIVNEPEGSEALPALLDGGWVERMRQHEMVVRVTGVG